MASWGERNEKRSERRKYRRRGDERKVEKEGQGVEGDREIRNGRKER
jgi:hypothetical protein